MRKELVIGGKRIVLNGTGKQIEGTEKRLMSLGITGMEDVDRVKIQQMLDNTTENAVVLYQGGTVYPCKRLVAELDRMKKSGSIVKMSNKMYDFLSLNFDIAHYNKQGYIATYNGEYGRMLQAIRPEMMRVPRWKTDVRNIVCKHLRIENN